MANTNDGIRDKILRQFYEIHKKGKGSTLTHVATNIKELGKIKSALGIDRGSFYSNLDYLVQKGWITKDDRTETQADRFGSPRNYHNISYRISAEGIDKLVYCIRNTFTYCHSGLDPESSFFASGFPFSRE